MLRFLLIFHGLNSLALSGASTHLALVSVALASGRPRRWASPKLGGTYARVTGYLYLGSVAIGACIYPSYRYLVRGLYLDRYEPWASNLFDMKETLAALGLPMAIGLILLHDAFKLESMAARNVFLLCAFLVFSIVIFDVVAGMVVVSIRSV